jgi:hypothetical protein
MAKVANKKRFANFFEQGVLKTFVTEAEYVR